MSEVTTEQLLPCPFCGGEPTSGEVLGAYPSGEQFYQTGCEHCEANGPSGKTLSEGDELWNKRIITELSRRDAVPVDRQLESAEVKGYDDAVNTIEEGFCELLAALGLDAEEGDGMDAAPAWIISQVLKQIAAGLKPLNISRNDEHEYHAVLSVPSQPSAADLSRFVGALDVAINETENAMLNLDDRIYKLSVASPIRSGLQKKRKCYEQHLSELQQLKRICEGGV